MSGNQFYSWKYSTLMWNILLKFGLLEPFFAGQVAGNYWCGNTSLAGAGRDQVNLQSVLDTAQQDILLDRRMWFVNIGAKRKGLANNSFIYLTSTILFGPLKHIYLLIDFLATSRRKRMAPGSIRISFSIQRERERVTLRVISIKWSRLENMGCRGVKKWKKKANK